MKKIVLTMLAVSLVCMTPIFAGETQNQDREAIKKTALNYVDGWFEGNVERMQQALHPDLTKRGVRVLPQTKRTILAYATATNMVEYTRAGFGKLPADQRHITVKILDLSPNTASVKILSAKYIDYAQMARIDGEWKIVNVLWEENKQPAQP